MNNFILIRTGTPIPGQRQKAGNFYLQVSPIYRHSRPMWELCNLLMPQRKYSFPSIRNFAILITITRIMTIDINFELVKTWDNKTQFTLGDITITTARFFRINNRHVIADPQSANAHFVCGGKLYNIKNTSCFATLEDWYLTDLLPKFQMLTLLETP